MGGFWGTGEGVVEVGIGMMEGEWRDELVWNFMVLFDVVWSCVCWVVFCLAHFVVKGSVVEHCAGRRVPTTAQWVRLQHDEGHVQTTSPKQASQKQWSTHHSVAVMKRALCA